MCNCDCDSAFYSEELNVYKVKKEVKCVLIVKMSSVTVVYLLQLHKKMGSYTP